LIIASSWPQTENPLSVFGRLRREMVAIPNRSWRSARSPVSAPRASSWRGRHGVGRRRPADAAEHFNWLVLSIPLNRAMALPLDTPPFTSDELDRYADLGTRAFIDAYAVTRPGGSDTTAEPRDQ
jgi:hypothetical protein